MSQEQQYAHPPDSSHKVDGLLAPHLDELAKLAVCLPQPKPISQTHAGLVMLVATTRSPLSGRLLAMPQILGRQYAMGWRSTTSPVTSSVGYMLQPAHGCVLTTPSLIT